MPLKLDMQKKKEKLELRNKESKKVFEDAWKEVEVDYKKQLKAIVKKVSKQPLLYQQRVFPIKPLTFCSPEAREGAQEDENPLPDLQDDGRASGEGPEGGVHARGARHARGHQISEEVRLREVLRVPRQGGRGPDGRDSESRLRAVVRLNS